MRIGELCGLDPGAGGSNFQEAGDQDMKKGRGSDYSKYGKPCDQYERSDL
jgi:hypothetical protein